MGGGETLGSLRYDDGDGNENGKKQNNNLARASRFLYISMPSFHDYNVNLPNFPFFSRIEQKTTTFFFFS